MKTLIVLSLFILIFSIPSGLSAENITARFIATSAAQYYQYPGYDYQSPIIGLNLDAVFFNLYHNIGVGGRAFFKFYSYDDEFQDLRYYEGFLHNFFNRKEGQHYFIYGFLGGIRKTDIEYIDLEDETEEKLNMIRPLLGVHFSKDTWGGSMKWTQTKKKKSKFDYEVQFRNRLGLIMQIGGSFKGPLTGIKSDFHIYAGYEFIL